MDVCKRKKLTTFPLHFFSRHSAADVALTMSWLLAVWISLGFLLLCQATLYQTIQQHHVARPGRTDILTLGTCTLLSLLRLLFVTLCAGSSVFTTTRLVEVFGPR